jgi:hypothetical protein
MACRQLQTRLTDQPPCIDAAMSALHGQVAHSLAVLVFSDKVLPLSGELPKPFNLLREPVSGLFIQRGDALAVGLKSRSVRS